MTAYIKRQDACAEVDRGDLLVGDNATWAKECINRTPPAEVEEVKHGSWEKVITRRFNDDGSSWSEINLKCSACGYLRRFEWKPYPNRCEECGAKMSGSQ